MIQKNLQTQITKVEACSAISTLFDPLHDLSYAETVAENHGISKIAD